MNDYKRTPDLLTTRDQVIIGLYALSLGLLVSVVLAPILLTIGTLGTFWLLFAFHGPAASLLLYMTCGLLTLVTTSIAWVFFAAIANEDKVLDSRRQFDE